MEVKIIIKGHCYNTTGKTIVINNMPVVPGEEWHLQSTLSLAPMLHMSIDQEIKFEGPLYPNGLMAMLDKRVEIDSIEGVGEVKEYLKLMLSHIAKIEEKYREQLRSSHARKRISKDRKKRNK